MVKLSSSNEQNTLSSSIPDLLCSRYFFSFSSFKVIIPLGFSL